MVLYCIEYSRHSHNRFPLLPRWDPDDTMQDTVSIDQENTLDQRSAVNNTPAGLGNCTE